MILINDRSAALIFGQSMQYTYKSVLFGLHFNGLTLRELTWNRTGNLSACIHAHSHAPNSTSKYSPIVTLWTQQSLMNRCWIHLKGGENTERRGSGYKCRTVTNMGLLFVVCLAFLCLSRIMEGKNVITEAEVQPGVRNRSCTIYWLFSVHLQYLDLQSMSTTASTETRERMKSSSAICHLSPCQHFIFEILSNIYFCLIELCAPPGTI